MRHFIRSVKYFVYILLILCLVIAILSLAGIVDSDPGKIFVNGYDSFWQIALLLAVFSAVYPLLGYARREAVIPGADEEVRPVLFKVMEAHGYVLEKEGDANWVFRKKSGLDRLLKSFEDRVTVTRSLTGFQLEGLNRDIVRLCAAIRDGRQD
ncbi:MAG: hypothetical protein J5871_03310 [Bacteroidales bacterium]|nr:hypothetical protein [Bacteroidales bacterium]